MNEEAGINMVEPTKKGILRFEFEGSDQLLESHVFEADRYQGDIKESDEMQPQWFDIDEIPYTSMWVDDIHWLPMLLNGHCFQGYFKFSDEQNLTSHRLQILDHIPTVWIDDTMC
jgi:8-oxo-dGTP diphosphatase/2-hydroxy-dATP diphosphatase